MQPHNTYIMELKQSIKAHGYTVSALAQALGISQPAATSLVNGNPTLNRLRDIAKAMGITLAELLADEQEQHGGVILCPHCGKPIKVDISAD